MIKPKIDSYCTEKDYIVVQCPLCSHIGIKQVFESDTSLYLNYIKIKKIHNKKFALCTNCKGTFEVDE